MTLNQKIGIANIAVLSVMKENQSLLKHIQQIKLNSMTDREKLLEELLSASKQMVLDGSWPVTEDELVKYHSSSFEFGFACGALWCKKSLPNEPVSDDLEEAAKNHKSAIHIVSPQWTSEVEKAFKAGACWQKEKMMKDAIEREVHEDGGGYPYIDATEFYDYDKDIPLAKEGDKIKVIMVKED